MSNHWNFIRLREVGPGRYQIVTEFMGNPIDRLAKEAMMLDPETNTDNLTLQDAKTLGDRIEKWMRSQNGRRGVKAMDLQPVF